MSEHEYKVGDKVEVVIASYYFPIVGEVCTVANTAPDGPMIQRPEGFDEVMEGDDGCWWAEPDQIRPYSTTPLTTHPTGAIRESKEGKGRPDLLLAGFPRALMALCRHMDCDLGRKRNWEKGLPESSLISSQFRHLLGYTSGVSEDTPEYNLTANVWNAMVLLEEYLRVQGGVMVASEVLDVVKMGGEDADN